jgi:hypothetical protein
MTLHWGVWYHCLCGTIRQQEDTVVVHIVISRSFISGSSMGYRRFQGHRGSSRRNKQSPPSASYAPPRARNSLIGQLLAQFFRWLFGHSRRSPSWIAAPPSIGFVPSAHAPPRRAEDKRARRERISRTVQRWNAADEPLPYRRQPHLVTKGERALWFPLYRAVQGRYRVFCKVRLQDVVCAPKDHPQESRWFKKIKGYHVDFVICDPQSTAPLLVVELDDRSHWSQRRQERDRFKNDVLAAAGMPIYRVLAAPAYSPDELAAEIDRMLASIRS